MAIKFTIIIFLIFGAVAIDEWIKDKFKIVKRKGFWQRPVNNVHKWLNRILFVLFITFIIISHKLHFDIGVFYVLYLLLFKEILRVFMEWKYEKETKRYILSLFSVMIWLAILMILYY